MVKNSIKNLEFGLCRAMWIQSVMWRSRRMTLSEEIFNGTRAKPVILLAEDDPDQSDMLREKLEGAGYSVDAVFSGDVALRCLTNGDYAAAIMDVRMPGLNGSAVLKSYQALGRAPATPVVMVSAFASPENLAQYRNDGAAASFAKPFKFADILACLRNTIRINS
jgi:DNA-binding response OmpR family regulator